MKKVLLIGSLALLGACSSNKTVETLTNVPPESIVAKEVYEYKAQAVVDQIEIMPEWFMKPPTSESMTTSEDAIVSIVRTHA